MPKLREYYNFDQVANMRRRTIGYPMKIPGIADEFAVVRPLDPNGIVEYVRHGWQVIHVKSGASVGAVYKDASAAGDAALQLIGAYKDRHGVKFIRDACKAATKRTAT